MSGLRGLLETLAAYTDYYRAVHGEAIGLWPLVTHVLQTFVDEDRAFQAWRRRSNGAPTGAPAGAGNGTGAESRNG